MVQPTTVTLGNETTPMNVQHAYKVLLSRYADLFAKHSASLAPLKNAGDFTAQSDFIEKHQEYLGNPDLANMSDDPDGIVLQLSISMVKFAHALQVVDLAADPYVQNAYKSAKSWTGFSEAERAANCLKAFGQNHANVLSVTLLAELVSQLNTKNATHLLLELAQVYLDFLDASRNGLIDIVGFTWVPALARKTLNLFVRPEKERGVAHSADDYEKLSKAMITARNMLIEKVTETTSIAESHEDSVDLAESDDESVDSDSDDNDEFFDFIDEEAFNPSVATLAQGMQRETPGDIQFAYKQFMANLGALVTAYPNDFKGPIEKTEKETHAFLDAFDPDTAVLDLSNLQTDDQKLEKSKEMVREILFVLQTIDTGMMSYFSARLGSIKKTALRMQQIDPLYVRVRVEKCFDLLEELNSRKDVPNAMLRQALLLSELCLAFLTSAKEAPCTLAGLPSALAFFVRWSTYLSGYITSFKEDNRTFAQATHGKLETLVQQLRARYQALNPEQSQDVVVATAEEAADADVDVFLDCIPTELSAGPNDTDDDEVFHDCLPNLEIILPSNGSAAEKIKLAKGALGYPATVTESCLPKPEAGSPGEALMQAAYNKLSKLIGEFYDTLHDAQARQEKTPVGGKKPFNESVLSEQLERVSYLDQVLKDPRLEVHHQLTLLQVLFERDSRILLKDNITDLGARIQESLRHFMQLIRQFFTWHQRKQAEKADPCPITAVMNMPGLSQHTDKMKDLTATVSRQAKRLPTRG